MALAEYRTALVTGATSGIGQATALALAERGLTVHVAARRADRLEGLSQASGIVAHAVDLRDSGAIYAAFSDLEADILINNAGVARGFAGIVNSTPEDLDATIDTNVSAVFHLLRAVLPGMTARRRGHVVNIGSVAGLYPIASAIYGGSKGAIHLLSSNLRIELQGTGVRVTEICPGRVTTEIFDHAFDDPEAVARVKDTGISELRAQDVADAILFALDAPAHVNISTLEMAPTEQTFGGMALAPLHRA